MPEKN
jgi:hypothetical protein